MYHLHDKYHPMLNLISAEAMQTSPDSINSICNLNSNRSSTTSKNHVDIEKEMDLKSFSHVVYTDVKFLHH